MCEAYVIPFLFGLFFTVCHPHIDVHFLKCFFFYVTFIKMAFSSLCIEFYTALPEDWKDSKYCTKYIPRLALHVPRSKGEGESGPIYHV